MTDNKNRELAMGIFSILFVSSTPLSTSYIRNSLNISKETLEEALEQLQEILQHYSPLFIQEVDRNICLRTKPEYSDYIQAAVDTRRQKIKLSDEALITLAIIAYGQPVRKSKIDEVRGVDSERTLDTLKKYGFIANTGHLEEPGAPLLYVTTPKFLENFGLKTLADLPFPSFLQNTQEPIKSFFLKPD